MSSRASRALTLVVLSSIYITEYLTQGHPKPRIESSFFFVFSAFLNEKVLLLCASNMEIGSLWRHVPIFVPYLLEKMVKKHLILLGRNSCTFAKVSKLQRDLLRAIFSSLIHSANFHFIFSNLSTHGPPKDVSKNSTTTREELGPSKVSCSS